MFCIKRYLMWIVSSRYIIRSLRDDDQVTRTLPLEQVTLTTHGVVTAGSLYGVCGRTLEVPQTDRPTMIRAGSVRSGYNCWAGYDEALR
ncbi:hypothetical protein KGM_215012 [Danaus plexippus plexippus]|uniref:Uncharacterized protein n=1 Tax=Danaus plexippus plexippus TaxID=278856 RepID=A0A212EYQ5_DANPL|nr:hypothetical protein KGM_215012 [Danaus plexippus plexippus]